MLAEAKEPLARKDCPTRAGLAIMRSEVIDDIRRREPTEPLESVPSDEGILPGPTCYTMLNGILAVCVIAQLTPTCEAPCPSMYAYAACCWESH